MKLKQFDIEAIKPHPENYNHHPDSQLSELEKSLDAFDQYKNIVVWNNLIIAGNGLYEAAKRKGLKKIYAIDRSDLSESQAKALLIADNATSVISEPDLSQLQVLLDSLGDVDIPGVNDDFFASVGMEWDNENDENDDEITELPDLNSDDRSPFQQMTFTLHDSQVEIVKKAIGKAEKTSSLNENSNGNALSSICEYFLNEYC